ncbi:MAG: cytochrome C biogenesis protein ResB, partial [Verrucomicrobia bacterium]
PAVLIRIVGPGHDGTKQPLLEIAPASTDPQHSLQYQLSRGGIVYATGQLVKGSSFATGWADWKATVLDFIPSASLAMRLMPISQAPGSTGFQAFLQSPDGARGPSEWIGPGVVTTLFHRDGFVRLIYGYEIQPLPFTVKLNKFTVPRYEGTDTPSNYISELVFQDKKNSILKEAVSKMNHPASFPGGSWASLTGLNYKFSQAQWNPADLRETTLQVLYDPGWLLKWIGSLGICIGIAVMFYFTPKRS